MGDSASKAKKAQDQLWDAAYEMKFQSKQMEKEAARVNAKAEAEKKRAKVFMDKGDMESAKMIAGETVRLRKEGINNMRMASKLGAVAAKLESASRANEISQQIKNAVPSLNNALKVMKKNGVSENMADFEKVFEDLDVQVESMSSGLDVVTNSSANAADVDSLLAEMSGAAVIDLN
jgi:charged multivesicular body protein 1